MNNIKPHKPHPRSKFSLEEDIILYRLVGQFGTDSWETFSKWLPGRNARQCRERWTKYLSPMNWSGPFLPEEDELLRNLYAQFGARWVKISQFFQRRTDIQVKNRWMVLSRRDNKVRNGECLQIDGELDKSPEVLQIKNREVSNANIDIWDQIDNIQITDFVQ